MHHRHHQRKRLSVRKGPGEEVVVVAVAQAGLHHHQLYSHSQGLAMVVAVEEPWDERESQWEGAEEVHSVSMEKRAALAPVEGSGEQFG